MPLYVEGLGMEALHVGMLLAIFAVVFTALQFFGGILSDRIGRLVPVTLGLAVCVVSLILMPSLASFGLLAVMIGLYGAAFALLFPAILALVADRTSVDERGRATGIFHSLLTAGVAVGAPIMGSVAQLVGVRLGLALCAAAAVVALVTAWVDLGRRNAGRRAAF